MSREYRFYDDRWRIDKSVPDQPHDVSDRFNAARAIMDDIAKLLAGPISQGVLETVVLEEMATAVFTSNRHAKTGLDLDETLKICMQVFKGEVYEYSERYNRYICKVRVSI